MEQPNSFSMSMVSWLRIIKIQQGLYINSICARAAIARNAFWTLLLACSNSRVYVGIGQTIQRTIREFLAIKHKRCPAHRQLLETFASS